MQISRQFLHFHGGILKKEVLSDITTKQLILAYATTAFAKCYQMKRR